MKPSDHLLQRLFKAAAASPGEIPGALPSRLEARTLAQWRSAAPGDESALLAVLFRRATICAGLILLLSAGWSRLEHRSEAAYAVALANYELTMHLPP